MASSKPLALRAHKGLAPFAGAVVVSLAAVLCLAAMVAGLGLLIEAERLWEPEYVSVTNCLVAPDGQTAISLFWSQQARGPAIPARVGSHSLAQRRPAVRVLWPEIATTCLTASPQHDCIFIAGQDGAIYAATAGQSPAPPALLAGTPERDIQALECSPDGRALVSIGLRDVCAWSTATGDLQWQRSDLATNSVAFDPHSPRLVCGLRSGEVVELDSQTGRTLRSITRLPYAVNEVEISPGGHWLACVGYERRVVLLSWPSGDRVWQSDGPKNFAGSFRVVCFSPSGNMLVTAAAENVRQLTLWDVASGQRLGELRGHEGAVLGARFLDGGRLVSWGTDGTIRTWDVERLTAVTSVRISLAGPAT